MTPEQTQRFMSKINKTLAVLEWTSDDPPTSGCWEWEASKNRGGYGSFKLNGKVVKAHRVSYELFKGDIPEGLQIDHICRNHKCVNPDHIEAVPPKENTRRGLGNQNKSKTHCKEGHEYTKENTYIRTDGSRNCRKCRKIEWRIRQNYQGGIPNKLKTHCIHGHEFTPENTYRQNSGRGCRACHRIRSNYQGNLPSALRTHCPRGHEYTPENTYVNKNRRACRICKRISKITCRQKLKGVTA